MSHYRNRKSDLRRIAPLVVNSLRGGDNVLLHCKTGLARAPTACAILSSILHNENLRASMQRTERLRNTQLYDRARDMRGRWCEEANNWELTLPRHPAGYAVHHAGAIAHAGHKGDGRDLIPSGIRYRNDEGDTVGNMKSCGTTVDQAAMHSSSPRGAQISADCKPEPQFEMPPMTKQESAPKQKQARGGSPPRRQRAVGAIWLAVRSESLAPPSELAEEARHVRLVEPWMIFELEDSLSSRSDVHLPSDDQRPRPSAGRMQLPSASYYGLCGILLS
jgi:hypothetical protein